MSEKVSSKTLLEIKTGEQIFDFIDECFYRHCRSLYNMREDEIPAYEKEVAMLNNQKWVAVEGLVAALESHTCNNCPIYYESGCPLEKKLSALLEIKEQKKET